jgi:AcrR family transcriptional regulator
MGKMLINSTASKLDPRVKRTRQLLQTAFTDLLRERDFHHITVQDISERAEVNRATFYAHFEDKYDLLNQMVRGMFQARLAGTLLDGEHLTLNNVRILFESACNFLADYLGNCLPATTHGHEYAAMVLHVQQQIADLLYHWLLHSPRRSGQEDTYLNGLATASSWAIFGSAFEWVRTGRALPLDQLVEQLLPALTASVQPFIVANAPLEVSNRT